MYEIKISLKSFLANSNCMMSTRSIYDSNHLLKKNKGAVNAVKWIMDMKKTVK